MYNTKFITVNGKDLYPGYLGREQRVLIRNQYMIKLFRLYLLQDKENKNIMWMPCIPMAYFPLPF